MWGKNILVVIIPLFLAITFLGQSRSIYFHMISGFRGFEFLTPLATWLGTGGAIIFTQGNPYIVEWGSILALTDLTASLAVNTLVTGLMVFKILEVFLEVERLMPETTSVERTLGSLRSSGGIKLQHIVFVIIESGMVLFAIQLVRIVLVGLPETAVVQMGTTRFTIAINSVIAIHEMFNVIIRSIHQFFFVLLITFI